MEGHKIKDRRKQRKEDKREGEKRGGKEIGNWGGGGNRTTNFRLGNTMPLLFHQTLSGFFFVWKF